MQADSQPVPNPVVDALCGPICKTRVSTPPNRRLAPTPTHKRLTAAREHRTERSSHSSNRPRRTL